ncbi:hypothetical protein AB6N35_10115 [Dietzia cinnamea]|uniref:Uncharacterized protein n=2 Tax=Dietzia cinnamea TaxID=321318 RepID=A0ABV3YIC1_9ACTN|nr:hypothetical protein [Dietzia cinnamea]MCT2057638.1 hypothetical protein [Dietzia cinnamea]MCT2097561.1 hypothetical protein [Dietzia cinnamea]MCT2120372.1 hypothetical protein [Dietzia cinnamea]MCT2138748.1 hypothetical protein [Dietzia cinnamea]MCT2145280.1 hypothetical protein [Dietzia cinnamea]
MSGVSGVDAASPPVTPGGYRRRMGSAEIITVSVFITRPWLLLQAPLTVEQVYLNAREILAGSTGGSVIS